MRIEFKIDTQKFVRLIATNFPTHIQIASSYGHPFFAFPENVSPF